MQKQTKFHHSVTENGNIQVRIVTEYLKDGKVESKKYGEPMTPADTKDLAGWDDRSKEIVAAIIDKDTLTEFEAECAHAHGEGIEECATYDRVIEEGGKLSVRRITRIFDDGVEVSKKFHRSWIMPGDDYGSADVMSKALAIKLHTPEVVAAYETAIVG